MQTIFEESTFVTNILEFHCPRYNELPTIDLYVDQVILFISEILTPFYLDEDDKILTNAMINNYVQQGIVSPSTNKKYSKNHMMYLIVVCVFKKMLSIHEICALIKIQIETYPIHVAYDYFCTDLENCIQATFSPNGIPMPHIASKKTDQTRLIRSTVLAFCNKLYIQKYIQYQQLLNTL
ncbi:hypothetical protein CS063_12435 [Sporanaerobium hydrogeniformans]|uniref:Uncharacterized protein n=1 Tax=Sporanaerobium hydrogeniformans TaxID=3072179 RepID=A0AC61DBI2_9FIRM|nr:DUF1836 domain-containing protein [Sporanaerobium hydrogeniformans]PHV70106.1 hypothetical protein CS063_12435 [Sporanaerobium hydrogeniformans]